MSAPVRIGMVGGGPGAFIGAVHRIALAMDGRCRLVAGAFSSDPAKSRQAGEELGLEPTRVYDSWAAMLEGEAALPAERRIEAVSIVTPNHVHHGPAVAALDAGFHVRVAATLDDEHPETDPALQALLDGWGVAREDQILRPVVHRGRAVTHTMGVEAGSAQLGAELTLTTAGAFWSPFGPTYREGKLETDLLLVRRTEPLSVAASAVMGLLDSRPELASDPAGFV